MLAMVHTEGVNNYHPQSLLLSCLHGVFLFALFYIYQIMWAKHSFNQNLFWLTAGTVAAIVTEHLKGLQLIKGSFDMLNIVFYEFAYSGSVYLSFVRNLKQIFIKL